MTDKNKPNLLVVVVVVVVVLVVVVVVAGQPPATLLASSKNASSLMTFVFPFCMFQWSYVPLRLSHHFCRSTSVKRCSTKSTTQFSTHLLLSWTRFRKGLTWLRTRSSLPVVEGKPPIPRMAANNRFTR